MPYYITKRTYHTYHMKLYVTCVLLQKVNAIKSVYGRTQCHTCAAFHRRFCRYPLVVRSIYQSIKSICSCYRTGVELYATLILVFVEQKLVSIQKIGYHNNDINFAGKPLKRTITRF